jgi:Mg2+-importing ATPase
MPNFSPYTAQTVQEVLKALDVDQQTGLRDDQVKQRRQQYGYNQLPQHGISWARLLLRQCYSPFIYLLFCVAIAAFFLNSTLEGLVILAILLLNILFGFFQEYRAEKTAQMIKKYLAPHAKVIRNEQEIDIPTKELVPGDILVLYPGDIIAADIRIVADQNLTIDESMLTGESGAVKKGAAPLPTPAHELFDAHNIGFAGTTVISGKALGVVIAIGNTSSLGSVASLLGQNVRLNSVSKIVGRLSRFILYLTLISLAIIIVVHLGVKGSAVEPLELLLFASALAVSVVPESLPLVTTFALSHGARRLAERKTIVKRLSAIEDLGNIEILCTDKTGTLTENAMTVTDVYGAQARMTLTYAFMTSGVIGGYKRAIAKGFDGALYQALTQQERDDVATYVRVAEIPFDPSRLCNIVLMRKNNEHHVLVRGAMEQVVVRCGQLTQQEKAAIEQWVLTQGKLGNRVLAVAAKPVVLQAGASYDLAHADTHNDLQFIGMIAFNDPLKKTAATAVAKAQQLGIGLKILSGDSKEVCAWVGRAIGIINQDADVMTGAVFASKTIDEKRALVQNYHVFARVTPEHKYEIVKLLQENKDVGYLGDGINDVLALKEAHVGIAVYDAVDVAREAADIILLKKSLLILVDGIQEGRRVFANTLKYLRVTMSTNFGNFYSIGIAALILDFLPILPVQILLVNLLADIPMVALATDTIRDDELERPEKYDIKTLLLLSTFLGLLSSLFDFIYFAIFMQVSPAQFQTGWFIMCLCTQILFIFSIRTSKPFFKASRPSWTLVGTALFSWCVALGLPFIGVGQELFSFVALRAHAVALILTIAVGFFVVSEIVKRLYGYVRTRGNEG